MCVRDCEQGLPLPDHNLLNPPSAPPPCCICDSFCILHLTLGGWGWLALGHDPPAMVLHCRQ